MDDETPSESGPLEELIPQEHGGALKRGNTKGVGRKSSALRGKLLSAADKFSAYVRDVATGKAVVVVPGVNGRPDKCRVPTNTERMEAGEKLLRYGLGTRQHLTADISKLTNDQVMALLEECDGDDDG